MGERMDAMGQEKAQMFADKRAAETLRIETEADRAKLQGNFVALENEVRAGRRRPAARLAVSAACLYCRQDADGALPNCCPQLLPATAARNCCPQPRCLHGGRR